jgi:hypothetical protein
MEPMLTTVRARYTEAIDLLYTEKTFYLTATTHFPPWVSSLPDRHRRLVRHLVLHFYYTSNYLQALWEDGEWDSAFTALTQLTGLKTLRIVVEDFDGLFREISLALPILRLPVATVLHHVYTRHGCEVWPHALPYVIDKRTVVEQAD